MLIHFLCARLLFASGHVTPSLLEFIRMEGLCKQKPGLFRSSLQSYSRIRPRTQQSSRIIDDRMNESTPTFPIPFLNSTFSDKHITIPLVWEWMKVVREDKSIQCGLNSLTYLAHPPPDTEHVGSGLCGKAGRSEHPFLMPLFLVSWPDK